jgi:hypothetical protein
LTYIERHADRAAAREAQARDHALEAIDEAITKFRADLWATEKKVIHGAWVEVPAHADHTSRPGAGSRSCSVVRP